MPRPEPSAPAASWGHYALYRRVSDAVYAIPAHFASRTVIEGIVATDLQTLNTVLGASIEEQVVATLNRMRPVWDPDDQYQQFFFQRLARTGMMDEYIEEMLNLRLSGIPAGDWIDFLRRFEQ